MIFNQKHRFIRQVIRLTRKLRFKFLLFVSIVLAIVFIASTMTVENYISSQLHKSDDARVNIILDTMARNSRSFLVAEINTGEVGLDLDTIVHEAVANQGDIEYAYIENSKGRIVANSLLGWNGKTSLDFAANYKLKDTIDKPQKILFFGQQIGTAHIGFNDKSIKEAVAYTRFLMGSIMLFALLLAIGGIYWLTGYILTPISDLIHGVKLIRRGDFTYRVADKGKDEIGVLARLFNDMTYDLKTKRILMQALSSYTSEELTNQIVTGHLTIDTQGEKKEATIVFIDIRGFTSLTMTREASFVVNILNGYFDIVTTTAKEYNGYIDKFIGDGAMVTFNTVVDDPDHKMAACRFALAVQKKLVKYFKSIREGRRKLHFGIGVASGEVITGNIGSSSKLDFTAIGDAVNKASRLEGLARSNEIILSDDMYNAVEDKILVNLLEPVYIKGFQNAVQVYALEGTTDNEFPLEGDGTLTGGIKDTQYTNNLSNSLLFSGEFLYSHDEVSMGKPQNNNEYNINMPGGTILSENGGGDNVNSPEIQPDEDNAYSDNNIIPFAENPLPDSEIAQAGEEGIADGEVSETEEESIHNENPQQENHVEEDTVKPDGETPQAGEDIADNGDIISIAEQSEDKLASDGNSFVTGGDITEGGENNSIVDKNPQPENYANNLTADEETSAGNEASSQPEKKDIL